MLARMHASIFNDEKKDEKLYLIGPRHTDIYENYIEELPPWRLMDRMKTVSVALVLCLNLNVDPPDIVKTNPCARMECWFDPQKCSASTEPIKQIGDKLQRQYQNWQRRARYKLSLDPTIGQVEQLCVSLRRNAKDERVLFHYNGHGVPRPTDNGEIWVFNHNYTQYIPLSVYELQSWLGAPSIYVYDCSNAGVLLKHFTSQGLWRQASVGSDGGESSGEGGCTAGPASPTERSNDISELAGSGAHQEASRDPQQLQEAPPPAAAAYQHHPQQQHRRQLSQRDVSDRQVRQRTPFPEQQPQPPPPDPAIATAAVVAHARLHGNNSYNTAAAANNVNEAGRQQQHQQKLQQQQQQQLHHHQQQQQQQQQQPARDGGHGAYNDRGNTGQPHSRGHARLHQQPGGNLSVMHPNLGTVYQVNPNLVSGNPNCQGNNMNNMQGQDADGGQQKFMFLPPRGGRPQESTNNTPQPSSMGECIHLCACSSSELLPMCPDLPADVFTACLTTPITMAVRWFLLQYYSAPGPPPLHLADKLTGELNDRRTVLGELNWIFTAITDTIAWNTLPLDLFQKLFRQDLLVAALFRNFLLAERILRSYGCCPVSLPHLPPTHTHPMWQSWDLTLHQCMSHLWPSLAPMLSSTRCVSNTSPPDATTGMTDDHNVRTAAAKVDPAKNNNSGLEQDPLVQANAMTLKLLFFQNQLSAFEVWLKLPHPNREPPEQLPVVLQVLLSQEYRPLALDLLCTFLSLGPWAVHLVLSVGIFPYILKLLQSVARDLRPALVTIWAKILSVEPSCKTDLVRDNGLEYFFHVLADTSMMPKHRGLAAFILSVMVNNDPDLQRKALDLNIIPNCLEQMGNCAVPAPYDHATKSYDYTTYDRHDMYRDACVCMWPAVCLAATWHNNPDVRWSATRDNAHEKLHAMLRDPVPEVRAACIHALGRFLSSLPLSDQSDQVRNINHSIAMTLVTTCLQHDAAPVVRMELAVALQFMALLYESNFTQLLSSRLTEREDIIGSFGSQQLNTSFSGSSYRTPSRSSTLFGGSGDTSTTVSAILSPAVHLSLGPSHRRSTSTGSTGTMHKASSAHAINSMGSSGAWCGSMLSSSGLYSKLWHAMQTLAGDPHPAVAAIAAKITGAVLEKARASLGQARCDEDDETSLQGRSLPLNNESSCSRRGESPCGSGHSSSPRPRHSAISRVSAIVAGESGISFQTEPFVVPVVPSPLPEWGSRLLVSPVTCPADRPPAALHFTSDTDLVIENTDATTPCDKPANVRLLPPATELQLLNELRSAPDSGSSFSSGTSKRTSRPARTPRIDMEVMNVRLTAPPSVLLFHPSLPHLVVCEKTHLSTFNLETGDVVNRWANHTSSTHRVTSACVLNDSCETPLLAVAADDGSVRVWENPFTRTATRYRDYAVRDPYYKTQWLETQSNTCASKTSKTAREFPMTETMSTDWRRKGNNLFVGSSFVGDRVGGFLGDGCRHPRVAEVLMGGYFAKGYGWKIGGSGGGSPAASTPSPSGSGGWGTTSWTGGGSGAGAAGVGLPAPVVNGWAAASGGFLEVGQQDRKTLDPRLVTAFTATTNVLPGMKGPGPLLSWCQSSGRLAVSSGDLLTLSLWDLRTELHAGDLLQASHHSSLAHSACITALHSKGPYISVGLSDGSVLLLDSRVGLSLPSVGGWGGGGGLGSRDKCIVQEWKEGEEWVVCAHLRDDDTILSGSVSGAVCLLDSRNRGSVPLMRTNSEITAMTANIRHDVFAVATVNHSLSVHDVRDGSLLNTVQSGSDSGGFLYQQRAAPVAAAAFHPDRPLLAAASCKTVAVYGMQRR